jgi:hypothetical protein
MSKTNDLKITPISVKSFTFKQSKHGTVPNLPLQPKRCRSDLGGRKKYQEDVMKLRESDKEKLYYDHYNTEGLEKIIDTPSKVILHMKKQKHSHLFSVLVIFDDFADDPSFSRHSKLLHSLSTRGRHNSTSTIASTQKFTAVAPIIRVNATFLCVYRLRNTKDLETFLEELSALIPRKELIEVYHLATREPCSLF